MGKKITADLLNYFWKKGIKPIYDKRISTYDNIMSNTESDYTPDALAVKEGFTEISKQMGYPHD